MAFVFQRLAEKRRMKPFGTLLLGSVVAIAAASFRPEGSLMVAAETGAPPERIGIYDSRVIAYAHFWSDAYQRRLNELTKAAQAAKAAGQTERFNELEATLKKAQEESHLQVFGTAPVDDVLAEIRDRLPPIQKAAGVARLVSKWDETALKKYKDAKQVDVTDLLLREFKLDEERLKVTRDIQKKKPLPLDKAQEPARKGKL